MSLRSKFIKLNKDAMELEGRINRLQMAYLKDTDISIEDDIDEMIGVYMHNFNNVYRKKFSFFSELKCALSARHYSIVDPLEAPHGAEILASASERTMFYIVNNCENYIPYDRKSQNEISDILYPIVEGINPRHLAWFYQMMKEKIQAKNVENSEEVLMYLQEMFSDFILLYLIDNGTGKKIWTTEEVCKIFLGESVIMVPKKNTKTRK